MAISSWSLVRVYGTWTDHQGMLLTGNYKIKVPTRLTNSADDIIIPAGVFTSGALNTTAGVPSLSVLCPSTDDPDIQQDGWLLEVEVTFTFGLAGEKYTIDVPIANRPLEDGGNGLGVNLRTIALTSQLPPQVAMYGVGVAGGLATLSEDGLAVLDADGNPIEPFVTWDALADKPAVVAAGADAAAVCAAIGALNSGITPGDSLQGAINAKSAAGGGAIYIQGQRSVSDDISLPRNVSLIGCGYGARIYAATDRYIKITGSGGGWLPSISNLTLDGVGIILGDSNADYANGVTLRDVEVYNVDIALTLRHNAWSVRGENLRIHDCATGIKHDFSPVASNSGANIVYTNSVVFNCSYAGFWQDDAAIDGWHVSFIGCNIEHSGTGVVLTNVRDGDLELTNHHFELNANAHIEANSGRIRLGPAWAMGLQAGNIALFVLSGTSRLSVHNSRIGWSETSKLAKLTGAAALLIEPQTSYSNRLGARIGTAAAPGNPGAVGSTVGISLPRGSIVEYGGSSSITLGHSGANATVVWIPQYDAMAYRISFQVMLSAAEAGNTLNLYLNPGAGGGNAVVSIPPAATWARVEMRWAINIAYIFTSFSDGSTVRSATALSHAIDVGRTLDARIAGSGSATGTLSNLEIAAL